MWWSTASRLLTGASALSIAVFLCRYRAVRGPRSCSRGEAGGWVCVTLERTPRRALRGCSRPRRSAGVRGVIGLQRGNPGRGQVSPGRVVLRVWAGGTPGAAPGCGCCARGKGEELQNGRLDLCGLSQAEEAVNPHSTVFYSSVRCKNPNQNNTYLFSGSVLLKTEEEEYEVLKM